MEWGTLSGLAVRNDHSKDIEDLRYFDQLNKQNQAMLEAKNKMFMDDIDFQTASNPFDAGKIKEEGDAAIQQLANLTKAHPSDWMYNPDVQLRMKQIKQGMKSSPAVLRSMAYKDAIAKLNADLADVAKNPNSYDTEAYQNILKQKDNYDKFGHSEGADGLARDGGPKPFVYQRPQDLINVTDTLLKAGKNINNFNVKKGKDLGEYMTEPKPEEVKAIKDSLYKQHARSIQLQAKELGLNTPEAVDNWLTNGIVAGFEPKYSPGDPNALWERGWKERELAAKTAKPAPSSYTPFDDLFDKRKPSGNIPAELAYKVWNQNPKITVVGNSGQAVNLTGQKMNYDGRYITDSKGRRYLTGYVNVPLDVAKQTGIWEGSEDDGGVTGAFMGKAVRRQKETKDGKGQTYVQVNYELPIDPNDGTARQLYNTHAQPQKLVNPLEYDNNLGGGNSLQVGQQQDGYEYTGGDPASQSSWKKI